MSYTDITQEIYDIVNANTDIEDTFNYWVKTFENFPSAVIAPSDWGETVFQTCSNTWLYNVTVRVVDRNTDLAETEPRMRVICDDLIWSLRSMPLWNAIDKIELTIVWGWTDDEEPFRTFEINCICTKLKSTI